MLALFSYYLYLYQVRNTMSDNLKANIPALIKCSFWHGAFTQPIKSGCGLISGLTEDACDKWQELWLSLTLICVSCGFGIKVLVK